VRVWHLTVRLFHRDPRAPVIAAMAQDNVGKNAMVWDFRIGYAALGLLAFRLLWGFAGAKPCHQTWRASFAATPI
jgi:cytochrome b